MRRAAATTAACLLALLTACARNAPPPETKAAAIEAGDALTAAGRPGQAVAAYRRALAQDPKDGRLRMKLAETYEAAQLWAEAGREAMRAADLLPGDYDARKLAARLILGLGRFEDSLSLSAGLLKERPDDAGVQVLWAMAQARLGSPYMALFQLGATGGRGEAYERACTSMRPRGALERDVEAEGALRRILARDPANFDARFGLIGLLWATRRADASAELLQTMTEEFPTHKILNEAAGHFFLVRDQQELGERYLLRAAQAPDTDAHRPRVALADHYLATGRNAEALALLDGLSATDEGGAIAVRRARAALNSGRSGDALSALEAVLSRYPANAEALAMRSRALLETGKTAEAVEAGRLAVSADALRYDGHLALARALEATQDLDGAFREYAEALKQDPQALALAVKLAQLGLATDRPRTALAFARQAVGTFPDDPQARLVMVEALTRAGDAKGADYWLAPLLTRPEVPVDAVVLRGRTLALRGDEVGARAAFEQALGRAPDSVTALAALVTLDLERGRVAEARARIDMARAARPEDPQLLQLAGRVRLAQGDLAGAEIVLRRARAHRPADTDTALLLAQTLVGLRKPADARELLTEVLQRRPSSLVAQTEMGGILEGLGRLHDAQAVYQAVIAEYPDAVQAAARLAVVLVTLGREPRLALNALAVARRIAPDDPAIDDAVAWALLHLEQVPEAITRLERAVRSRPDDAGFHYHLGAAYIRDGQLERARATLTRALALEPSPPDRARIDAELARIR